MTRKILVRKDEFDEWLKRFRIRNPDLDLDSIVSEICDSIVSDLWDGL
jgi:hypothetical protein